MNNKFKIALIVGLLSSSTYASEYIIRVGSEPIPVNDVRIVTTDWAASSAIRDCSAWLPNAKDTEEGEVFTQTTSCSQDFERNVKTYSIDDNSLISDATETDTRLIESEQEAVGTYVSRSLCDDILRKNASSGSGVYDVDYDGDGSAPSVKAYCEMTNGGWTLYDNFGVAGGFASMNSAKIYSEATLISAGYETNLTDYNTWSVAYQDHTMHFWWGWDPSGSISKTMPDWVEGIRVDAQNFTDSAHTGDSLITVDSESKVIARNTSAKVTFSHGGKLTIYERNTSVTSVNAVWVK